MPKIEAEIPESTWTDLKKHVELGSRSLDEVVSEALAIYFQTVPDTLFQVSTSTALVEGVYRGAITVGQLRQHGDLGLGTFENLDGEMIIVDGEVFQARSDGSVQPVGDEVLAPFAVTTRFLPNHVITIDDCPNYEYLCSKLDSARESANFFYAFRVRGLFDLIHLRAICKTDAGVPFLKAASVQPEFKHEKVEGTLVGFWSPDYAKSVSVPGYHLHFLSKKQHLGGHVLDCSGANLKLESQRQSRLAYVLPETEEFLQADLTRDPTADLAKAEKSQSKEMNR